ncbi:MAG: hypothetical protein WC221_08040 [Candidatus Riflebacteria bacterium]
MQRYIFITLFLSVLLSFGCTEKPKDKDSAINKANSSKQHANADSDVAITQSHTKTDDNRSDYKVATNQNIKLSPIEYAQKEYLDAYNDYVRLLRESGPQTIETLQALAIYQKKYQIYQMFLKAAEKN